MAKAAARQGLVKVSGIVGHFATKSGGDITSDTTKVYDGGATIPDTLASPAQGSNVTVGRPYDDGRDGPVLKRLRNQVGRWRTTVSVTPTNEDLVAIGQPVVYSNALLVGLTDIQVDSSSGDAQTFTLEFAVSTVK